MIGKKCSFFFGLSKHFFYSLNLLGVKEKVLGIEPRKILRPDPGLYSQYIPSYAIFCESQIFRHAIFMQFSCFFWLSFRLSYKVSLTLAMLLCVKGKVLEIDSQKILRPDSGLYSQYFPSYDIFGEPQIFRHPIFNLVLNENKNLAITKNGITRKVLWVQT